MSVKTIEASVAPVDINLIRGDTFNKLLFIYRDVDDSENEIPANLKNYEFALQVRVKEESEEALVEFDNSYFYTGQTEEAIQYDIDQGNPAGTTHDEVHILVPANEMEFQAGKWVYDMEFQDTNGYITTVMAGRFILNEHITRGVTYT